MTDLVIILLGVGLGLMLGHSAALKSIKQSIEIDLAAIHARFDELKEKL
jgi:hypothetical protein